jgi:hypothetical protein
MTRHGLQLPDPAITTMLETRTLASVADSNRKCCDRTPKRQSNTWSRHQECAWLMRSEPSPGSNRSAPQTTPNPKSP